MQGLARWAGDTPVEAALADCLTVLVAGRRAPRPQGDHSLRSFWTALLEGTLRSWIEKGDGAQEYARLREQTRSRYYQARELAREQRPLRSAWRDEDPEFDGVQLSPAGHLETGWRARSGWLPQMERVFVSRVDGVWRPTDVHAAALFLGADYPREFAVDQIAALAESLLFGNEGEEQWQAMISVANLALSDGVRWLCSAGPVVRLRGYSLLGGLNVGTPSQASPRFEAQSFDEGERVDLVVATDDAQTYLTAFPSAGIARGTSVPRSVFHTADTLVASEDRLLTILNAAFRPRE